MKITIAKSAGFCFGVKRALAVALEAANTHGRIEMLGDIVHNEDVVRKVKKAGIKKIKALVTGKGRTLLIRAHGASKQTMQKAAALGYIIIDATCPMVKEIHKIARGREEKGYKIIIIGDKQHDEVRGIMGQLRGKATVIHDADKIPCSRIKKFKKVAVVVQSTQNIDKVKRILASIKQCVRQMLFFNTICRPTRIKQQEIKSMPLSHDVMVIIGSKTSANTKRLWQIAKSLNEKSYWIHSQDELKKTWFKGAKSVGITSGASTPEETTQKVAGVILRLTRTPKRTL